MVSKILQKKPKNRLKHMREIDPDFEVSRQSGELHQVFYKSHKVLDLTKPSNLKDTQTKRCLLFASGPSAKQIDLSRYDDEPIFFMNGSIQSLNSKRDSATFFVADDSHFVRNSLDTMIKALELADHLFLSSLAVNILCKELPTQIKGKKVTIIERANRLHDQEALDDKEFYLQNNRDPELIFAEQRLFSKKGFNIGFSKNLGKGYFSARTIPYCAMQIAYHLGFRKFHIAGMDLTAGIGRFYEENKPLATTLGDDYDDHIFPSFKLAGEIARREGWVITNLSQQSRLPSNIIPKI
jgi:Kdo-III transferase WaaZ